MSCQNWIKESTIERLSNYVTTIFIIESSFRAMFSLKLSTFSDSSLSPLISVVLHEIRLIFISIYSKEGICKHLRLLWKKLTEPVTESVSKNFLVSKILMLWVIVELFCFKSLNNTTLTTLIGLSTLIKKMFVIHWNANKILPNSIERIIDSKTIR